MALAMLAQLLRGAIDADRYPFSPEIRILKEILAMIRQEPSVRHSRRYGSTRRSAWADTVAAASP